MRIISGKFKGRRISAPSHISARPTTDFAKEGLFNLFNNRIDFEGIDVLDLFAGTGSIGVEFVSRGCRSVVSVEQQERQAAFIRKLCVDLNIQNLSVIKTDVFKFLASCRRRFDVIFADPPYDLPALPELPDWIFSKNLLADGGLFVLEHPAKYDFQKHLNCSEQRRYGNVNFSFFEA